MFLSFYLACSAIFLIQGLALPVLVLISGLVWRRQRREIDAFNTELQLAQHENLKSSPSLDVVLQALPKLQPLMCDHCGAGLLLQETQTFCPHCQKRGGLPEDYAAVTSLRLQIQAALKRAIRYWWAARVLSFRPLNWIFFLMIFAEPFVLFVTVLVGSSTFRETWLDKQFALLGETASFLIMLTAFCGLFIWMFLFIFLASLSKSLRTSLPAVPVFDPEIRGKKTASCQACGGGIEYEAGDFACICSYCNVDNYRVEFAKSERAKAEKGKTRAKSALFAAMGILEDYVGTFFFVGLILGGAFILLVIWIALTGS
jgi:Zn finger protein HypA/HybF involved in hydrogenase expression